MSRSFCFAHTTPRLDGIFACEMPAGTLSVHVKVKKQRKSSTPMYTYSNDVASCQGRERRQLTGKFSYRFPRVADDRLSSSHGRRSTQGADSFSCDCCLWCHGEWCWRSTQRCGFYLHRSISMKTGRLNW